MAKRTITVTLDFEVYLYLCWLRERLIAWDLGRMLSAAARGITLESVQELEKAALPKTPDGWVPKAHGTLHDSAVNTHEAVRMLTDAGASEALAVSVVDVIREALKKRRKLRWELLSVCGMFIIVVVMWWFLPSKDPVIPYMFGAALGHALGRLSALNDTV